MSEKAQPIFTLDARDNVMLEVTRDYFGLSPDVMQREIQAMHRETQRILAAKSVTYGALKSALVPLADRYEAAFMFDSREVDSSWYGERVARLFLPLLDKRTTQSVLCGDLIGRNQDLIFEILDRFMILARSFEFVRGGVLYCVYVNNLTDAALVHLHRELSAAPAYLGFIPTTFQSVAKTYLSFTLVNAFLKCQTKILMPHEDDRPNEENVNMLGYCFEACGYRPLSLQASYFGLFLSYKIQRAIHQGFEIDTEMALNTASTHVLPLNDFQVRIENAKFEYLQSQKLGRLRQAGIANLDRQALEASVKERIAGSYIYNLVFLEEYNVAKFNVMLEFARSDGGYPARLVAAMEYQAGGQMLRLITLT